MPRPPEREVEAASATAESSPDAPQMVGGLLDVWRRRVQPRRALQCAIGAVPVTERHARIRDADPGFDTRRIESRRAGKAVARRGRIVAVHLHHAGPDERTDTARIPADGVPELVERTGLVAAAPEHEPARFVRASERRVQGDGAIGRGTGAREIVLFQISRGEVDVRFETLRISRDNL